MTISDEEKNYLQSRAGHDSLRLRLGAPSLDVGGSRQSSTLPKSMSKTCARERRRQVNDAV